MLDVNYFAVLAGAIAAQVLGFLWYGPLFGKQWMALSGHTPEKLDALKARGGMGMLYALAFVGALVMSYILAHFLTYASAYTDTTGIPAGLSVGFWSWLGFVAPVTLGTVLWDGKPWKLWLLNNGYQLLILLTAGVILSVWQ